MIVTKSATLTRDKKKSGPDGTFGAWASGTGFKSATLERPPTGPHPCIPLPPTGTYLCELAVSPCFYAHNADFGYGRGMVYHVRNVPGRDHILIHPANWAVEIKTAKEEKHLQIEGCIAPGAAATKVQVPEPDGRLLPGITSSVFATKALMADMQGQPFLLTILEV